MSLAEFSFEISEGSSETAYRMVQDKFKEVHNRKWVKQENPPNSFNYQTGWVKGTISLSSGDSGTKVTGTVEPQTSFIVIIVLFFVVGFIVYGFIGAIFFTILSLIIFLPMYFVVGRKHQNNLGPKLSDALQGTNFKHTHGKTANHREE